MSIVAAVGLLSLGACDREAGVDAAPRSVVLYCSVDETFARRVLDVFHDRTGVAVEIVFDSEAGKTTGLVNRIVAEARSGRPRADVFWSSEVFNTILLGRRDLLESYAPTTATGIPARFKDSQHRWTATAVRARVLAFDPKIVVAKDVPTSWEQLGNKQFASHVALANPLFGTTRGHVAAMFALWGKDRARAFLTRLSDARSQIVAGNSSAVRAVMSKSAKFAATDTDDVYMAQKNGASLTMTYLDMGGGGTLLIPCTVAMVNRPAHPDGVRRLVDFLASADVERMLATSDSHNIPVRATLRDELGIAWPAETQVDYGQVADAMGEAVAAVREILIK